MLTLSSASFAGFTEYTDQASFLSAAGNTVTESFETSAGSQIAFLATPNFTLTHNRTFSVLSAPSPFGTSATDGVRYIEETSAQANEMLFQGFAANTTAFGLFITDFGDFGSADLTLTVNNNAPIIIASPFIPNGDIRYFGIVATGGDIINSVTLASGDAIGIDEVSVSAVPLPAAAYLMVGALLTLRIRQPGRVASE